MNTAPGPLRALAGRTFRSLGHRNYRLYFVGQLVSLVGTWMQNTALAWYAYEITGNVMWPSFVIAAQMVPSVFLGSLGGWLADHYPKRRLLYAAQYSFIATSVLLAGVAALGWANVWVLLTVMLIRGLIQTVDFPVRLAFVPGLVPREDLTNAIGLNSLLFNSARLLGPALAAATLALAGPAACFLLNGLSYLGLIVALRMMSLPPDADGPREGGSKASFLSGFRVVAREPRLLLLIALAGCVAVTGWPLLTLLTGYAGEVLGMAEGGYAALLSAIGVGALVGSLAVASVANPRRQRAFLMAGVGAVCVGLTGLAWTASFASAVFWCGLFGLGMILFFPTGQSMLQLGTADEERGRVMGLWAMMMSTAVPTGNLILGPLAGRVGVDRVVAGQGVAAGLILAAMAVLTARSGLRRSRVTPEPQPALAGRED